MANIVVKTTLEDGTEISWDKKQIVNIESKIQSTSNPSSIYYGVLPSSGNLEIVDSNDEIKTAIETNNIDINNLSLSISIDDKNIRQHIVSDSSYDNNTKHLKLQLTDVLNKWKDIMVPEMPISNAMTAWDLVESLSQYSTDIRIDLIGNNTKGGYAHEFPISGYLGDIDIKYPYYEQGSLREQFDKICTLAQLQLIVNEYGIPQFVDAQSNFTDTSKIIYIPKEDQYSDLNYDLIKHNKYDTVKIGYTAVSKETAKETELLKNAEMYVLFNIMGRGIIKLLFDPNKYPSAYNLQIVERSDSAQVLSFSCTVLIPNEIDTSLIPIYVWESRTVGHARYKAYPTLDDKSVDWSLETNSFLPLSQQSYDEFNAQDNIGYAYKIEGDKIKIKGAVSVLPKKPAEGEAVFSYAYTKKLTLQVKIGNYTMSSNTVSYGEGDNAIEINGNELIQMDTIFASSNTITEEIANNILDDYKNGLSSATITVGCSDYNNIYGGFADVNSNIIETGNIVQFEGNSSRWMVTSSNFRKRGCPFIDLQLIEARNPDEYTLYLNSESVKLTATRTSSVYANAPIGELNDRGKIYYGDEITMTAQSLDGANLIIIMDGKNITDGKSVTYFTWEIPPAITEELWDIIDRDYSVSAYTKDTFPSLENSSWEDISKYSEEGIAQDFYNIGDEKTITLNTGEVITLVILGFSHDDLSDGSGKAGITFGMKNLLSNTYKMNDSATNVGGWMDSKMRTETMAMLLEQLPNDLRNVIKLVNKPTSAGNESKEVINSLDKLWLFSYVEITGTSAVQFSPEGSQYEYWRTIKDGTTQADRIKYLSNGIGDESGWWLRSSNNLNNNSFLCVNGDGNIYGFSAKVAYGVSFGFCV